MEVKELVRSSVPQIPPTIVTEGTRHHCSVCLWTCPTINSGFNVSEIWISRFVYLGKNAITFFSCEQLLPIGYRRMIQLLFLNRIKFNCSRFYCYQVIFYFFSKITGKSGT